MYVWHSGNWNWFPPTVVRLFCWIAFLTFRIWPRRSGEEFVFYSRVGFLWGRPSRQGMSLRDTIEMEACWGKVLHTAHSWLTMTVPRRHKLAWSPQSAAAAAAAWRQRERSPRCSPGWKRARRATSRSDISVSLPAFSIAPLVYCHRL